MRIVIFISSLGAFFNLYLLQAIFPKLSERFDTSVVEVGWLNMAALAGMLITAPVAGFITARLAPQNVIVSGFAALCLLNVCLAFLPSHELLFATRLAQGVTLPFILTASMNIVSGREAHKNAAVSIYVAGTILGSTLSRFYPAWASSYMSWETVFVVAAAVMGLTSIAVHLIKRSTSPSRLVKPCQSNAETIVISKAFSDKALLVTYFAGFALLFTQSAFFTAIGIKLAEPPYSWSSAAIGMIYIACVPALFFVLASKRIKELLGRQPLIVSLICLMWASIMLIEFKGTAQVVGVAGFAIATYLMQTITTEQLSRSKTVSPSLAAGFYLAFYYLGGSVGAIMSAYAYEAWAWNGVIACVAIIQVVISFLILGVKQYGMRGLHHVRAKT